MSMPGWYPDPAGTPGRFRYWDGRSWSAQTTADPASTPPGGSPGPSGAPAGFEPQRQRSTAGPVVVVAVLLVLALLVWAMFFRGGSAGGGTAHEDTNSATPSGSVWNEKDTPTPTPSGTTDPAPSNGGMVSCPTGGGNVVPASGNTLTSTGLSVNRIDGWDKTPSFDLEAIRDVQVQLLVVYQGSMESWLSGQLVGRLAQADGFTNPRTSAQQIMDCFATSGYYTDYTGRKDLKSEAVTIDGHKGWHLQTEIHVSSASLPGIDGDRMDIVVVDTGQTGSLAIYCGWATIGDTAREAQVDQAVSSLHVG